MKIDTVLLVDDEADLRRIAELSLGAVGGWRVLVATSGPEACRIAAEGRPDVILLDAMMPGMDGAATLEALRASPETASIPVIFLTAKSRRAEAERFRSMGALGVISKPFDPMGLPGEVRRIVAGG